jgi:hypothetical protein
MPQIFGRHGHEPADNDGANGEHQKRRIDPAHPHHPERPRRKTTELQLVQNLRRHEVAGDHQENIDADEASGKSRYLEVEADDSDDRKRPERIDIKPEGVAARRAACGLR